jgi:hypothetical protein
MEANIETLTIRLDAMTGGFAVLYAVVQTHPNPRQLSAAFELFAQSALSQHTHSALGDALLGGIHVVAEQIRSQFRSLETGSAAQS